MKKLRRALALLLAAAMIMAFAGCEKEVTAENLMENVEAENASEMDLNSDFCKSYNKVAFGMLQSAYSASGGNVVISPLSVFYHLGILGNGAEGATRDSLEEMFGKKITVHDLNVSMHSYLEQLKDTDTAKIYFENALWFNSDKNAKPNDDFLKNVASYYGASAYKDSFSTDAVTNINNWISNQTNMDIEYMLDDIPNEAPLYMLSAAVLNADWASPYSYDNIQDGTFTSASGIEEKAQMMSAFENKYLETDSAIGFVKNYAGGNYAFVAILPNHNDITGYVSSLSVGGQFDKLLQSSRKAVVDATVPKFSCEYKGSVLDIIKNMGVDRSFIEGSSQLGGLGECDGNMYAGDLYVRTIMSVTEKGTSKGTAATVTNKDVPTSVFVVTLNRPFIYAVVDTRYNLPILVGAVNTLND